MFCLLFVHPTHPLLYHQTLNPSCLSPSESKRERESATEHTDLDPLAAAKPRRAEPSARAGDREREASAEEKPPPTPDPPPLSPLSTQHSMRHSERERTSFVPPPSSKKQPIADPLFCLLQGSARAPARARARLSPAPLKPQPQKKKREREIFPRHRFILKPHAPLSSFAHTLPFRFRGPRPQKTRSLAHAKPKKNRAFFLLFFAQTPLN